jgi:DNA repair exonuclease SbcCD nuclease subunit
MSTRPFRFVHASDFHLEQPLMGVAEVPDHLRDLFLDAPYLAARSVFDTVLAEDADFLVLPGDILHADDTGPRGPLFLVEQFLRLAERGIGVYWAGGAVDLPDAWPAALALPPNVHVFPQGRVEDVVVERNDALLARLVGASRDRQHAAKPNDFVPDPAGMYSIAAMHGEADTAVMQARAFPYWALGGRHDRCTPASGQQIIHYCGSPQGRCPDESGVHGCTLVQVDGQRQTRTSLIPTEAVRWLNERLVIDASASREELETRIRDRIHALLDASPTTGLLIRWTIAGQGPMITALRRTRLAAELLEGLRDAYGHGTPAAWSLSLDVELSETLPPEWYEQETIRGDFLRAVRQLQMNPEEPLALETYMAESHLAGILSGAAGFSSQSARDAVLREAATLGVDLLSGEESQP